MHIQNLLFHDPVKQTKYLTHEKVTVLLFHLALTANSVMLIE